MGWLRDTFPKPKNDSTEVERIRYAQTYILKMIEGYLMPDLSLNLVHLRWNFSASYVGIPTALENIRLLLDQRLEAQFQWIPYEDPTIWAVILDEFFQIRTFGVLRIHGKSYLLSEERRSRQIRVEMERWSPLNLMRRDDGTVPSTVPTQSQGPTPQTDDTHTTTPSNYASPMPGWNAWSNASPFSITPTQPTIYSPSSQEESHDALSGSPSHYQSLSPYRTQTPLPWVMQTPLHSLLYQGTKHAKSPKPRKTWNKSRLWGSDFATSAKRFHVSAFVLT
ncbi:hypothetical protein J1N35_018557 [Gossypium stocksii]|uniref:Aminotransferase-like plant mobile domain-containing protein n=1 Tax=Gossypium stocksii TaxID=47602 RepID=A0A9D4A772_9ROSI|nr:hypothetical protein J1N35_018557 [Gossypium stocksii]